MDEISQKRLENLRKGAAKERDFVERDGSIARVDLEEWNRRVREAARALPENNPTPS